MMTNINKSNEIQGNQIISDFAIDEELLEFFSDPDKLNDTLPDQITEQYPWKQHNTHTS